MAYKPSNPGKVTEVAQCLEYVERELAAIMRAMQETTVLELRPSFAPPPRPREGMIVFADGTSWNPGAGKGVYTFLSGAWSKL